MKNGIFKYLPVIFATFAISTFSLSAAELNKGIVKESTAAYSVPNEEAKVSCYLSEGEELVIADETDEYYGVFIENNEVVYIEKSYIHVQNSPTFEEPVQKAAKQDGKQLAKGEEVVSYAKQFIGLRYRSGGADLQTGVDCSGFTQQIYAKFNIKLQRSSRDQFASNGRKVTRAELMPGDLVFYGVGGYVRHVAIYVGNDQIIHAPVPGKSVCIVPIQQRGDDPIIGYRRIFE